MCVLLLKYFFICAAAAEPKRSSLDSQTIESDQVIVTFFNSLQLLRYHKGKLSA